MTQGGIHILVGKDTQQHADITKESGDDHTLYDDEFQNAPGLRTDGLTDTELMSTFLHSDKHDVRYAYDTR